MLALRVFAPQKSSSTLVLLSPQKTQPFQIAFLKVAGWTRLELATSCVTGRVILHNYQFIRELCWKIVGCSSSKYMLFYLSVNLANYLLIASKKSIFSLYSIGNFQQILPIFSNIFRRFIRMISLQFFNPA